MRINEMAGLLKSGGQSYLGMKTCQHADVAEACAWGVPIPAVMLRKETQHERVFADGQSSPAPKIARKKVVFIDMGYRIIRPEIVVDIHDREVGLAIKNPICRLIFQKPRLVPVGVYP